MSDTDSESTDPVDANKASPVAKTAKPSFLARIDKQLGVLLAAWAKFAVLVGVFLLVLFVVSEVNRVETFSIADIEMPQELKTKGYSSKFMARRIAHEINSLTRDVPTKLEALIAKSEIIESEKQLLRTMVANTYGKDAGGIDIDLSIGIFSLSINQFLDYLKGWIGIERNAIESTITVQNHKLTANVVMLKNGVPVSHARTATVNEDSDDALEQLIGEMAKVILEVNDPLVMVLQDYKFTDGYSSRNTAWPCRQRTDGPHASEKIDPPELEKPYCFYDFDTRKKLLNRAIQDQATNSPLNAMLAYTLLGDVAAQESDSSDADANYDKAFKLAEDLPTSVIPASFTNNIAIRMVNRILYAETPPDWQQYTRAAGLLTSVVHHGEPNRTALDKLLNVFRQQRKILCDDFDARQTYLLNELDTLAKAPDLRHYKDFIMSERSRVESEKCA